MDNKRILITGSSGMLGVDLTFYLNGMYEICCTDLAPKNNPRCDIKSFYRCDITDKTATVKMIKETKPDVIIHSAAWTDVDGCEEDPDRAMKINAEGTHNIASGAKEVDAVLLYLSSDFIFDGEQTSPYREDDTPRPINVYGASKFKGESYVRKELSRYFIIRTSWLFGRHGRNFVDIILDKAERKESLRIVVDQFGSPTYTVDLCKAIDKMISAALEKGSPGGVYHFSNNGSCSWYKYAEVILKLSSRGNTKIIPITSEELDRPAKRPKMSILNTDKYALLSGEVPRSWERALEDYLFNDLRRGTSNYVQNFKK